MEPEEVDEEDGIEWEEAEWNDESEIDWNKINEELNEMNVTSASSLTVVQGGEKKSSIVYSTNTRKSTSRSQG